MTSKSKPPIGHGHGNTFKDQIMRPTLIGSILGLFLAPVGLTVNSLVHQMQGSGPSAAEVQQQQHLSDSLAMLSSTLVSFESRQTGSEKELARQLEELASSVAQTQRASQTQIDQLTASIEKTKQVAMQPSENSEFKELLKNFGSSLEQRIDTSVRQLVASEVQAALPAEGVGTLDVNNRPGTEADDESIQTIVDAARRIQELEREVSALKGRSLSYQPGNHAPTQYQGYQSVSSNYGNGCTGTNSYGPAQYQGYQGYQSVGSNYGNGSTGTNSYAPMQYEQYQEVEAASNNQRQGLLGRLLRGSPGTCRMVNGVRVCN